jgi:hypothetical protein
MHKTSVEMCIKIAVQLKVDQSTIHRDIQAIKEEDLKFVFDLAKKDLAQGQIHDIT